MKAVNYILAQRGLIAPVANYEGAMPNNGMVRLTDIVDGTAQTILVAEAAGRPQRQQAGRYLPSLFSAGGPWACVGNRIEVWGSTPDGAGHPGPCAINCSNDQEVYSFHSGGANLLFADGSVHFLRATIDIRLFAQLVTRAGGEVVTATDF
jgi:prepilin-type processing-associated H-X9-DG protein